jgi:PAS domain S-box-containing protein
MLEISKQIMIDMDDRFEFDSACCVDEAFKKLSTGHYDVVISDYEMPQKNGVQFLEGLREQNNEIPFILFTGKGREEVVVKALNLGADSYINKNGSPETVYCELVDAINKTVERKKTKKALAESELNYRTVVEKSLQGILITQTSPLRLVFANESMGNILGYSTVELKSLSPLGVAGLIYDEDKAVFFSRLESRMRGEPSPSSLEFRAVRKNGSIVWLEAFASRIEYMGKPAVQGMFLDIDERKKVSEILRESEERYRELANSLPNIVYESDTAGKLVFVNERALESAGYSNEDFEKGLNILQFIVPEDRERAMKSIQRLLAGGSYVPAEYVFLRKDGTTFPALITTTLRISKNKVTGLRGVVIDITESNNAEQLLKKNQEQLKAIILNSPMGIAWSGLNQVFLSANESFCRILGYSEDELRKLTFKDFTHPDDVKESISKMEDLASRRISFFSQEKRYIRKDGAVIYGKVTVSAIRNKEGEPTLFATELEDITERKKKDLEIRQKNEALVQERDMLESVTAASGAGLVIISKDYHVEWANDFIKRYKGDTIGKLCYATLNSLDSPCQDCGVAKIYAGKTTLDSHEYCSTTVDGNPYWVEIVATPLTDEKGNVTSAVEICVDITERKKNEEKLRESLHKNELTNEKLRVVGSLTRHDVGNKLMVVKSNIYLLKKQIGDNPKLAKYLEDINLAINQTDKMFEFSRFYEKIGVEEPAKIDVAQCFNQAAMLLPRLDALEIVNVCPGLEVMADSLLKQLFYNFLDNSLKHGEKVTQIRLHYTEDDNGLKLFYEDNGIGVSEADKPKLFHEGFSTGKSTGLGLFLIKKMVEAYGWTINEEGEPGKGAKFTITIPELSKKGKENYQIA